MGLGQALKTGLTKSFQFSDRASRSEFWYFAPLWSLVCLLLLIVLRESVASGAGALMTFAIVSGVSLPIWSVGVRRVNDAGYWGGQFIATFLPLVICGASMFLAFGLPASEAETSKLFMGLAVVAFALFVPLSFFGFGHFTRFGEAIGLLLVPSEPKTNRFGPNPNEVPS